MVNNLMIVSRFYSSKAKILVVFQLPKFFFNSLAKNSSNSIESCNFAPA
jgi:hypothetical protein